jgi:hypothetical protein
MAAEHVIRASDSDREHAVHALRDQYAEGRLTLEEFDERTSAAYAAKTWTDLRELTSDLPVRLSFGPASAAVAPGSGAGAPGQWGQRWPGTPQAWRFVPLLPILLVWIVVAGAGAWSHARGQFFPFFPVIPLTIFSSVFAWRWLLFRQWRRHPDPEGRR